MPTTISSAPTAVRRTAGQRPVYYDYEEVRRRRPVWPWLLALILVAALVGAGWYVYDQIQDQLSANEPVAVPDVTGIRTELAINQLVERGLDYDVQREPNRDQPDGFVFDQDPRPGRRIDPETDTVTLLVSTGIPRVEVPDVRGSPRDEAVATLTELNLDSRVVEVFSDQPPGSVIAQDPRPGEKVEEGTTVRINVSRGIRPVSVPAVEGQPFESASATLQAAGFQVTRNDVDSNQPEGTVLAQDPPANSSVPKGSTVTLTVSKGPQTEVVPDVTSFQREDAVATLRAAGFKVNVVRQDTDDPSLENVVLSQDPEGGTDAEPKTRITIVVGHFVEPPPPPPDTTTETTEEVP